MHNKTVLSVCIPTFNRPKELRRLLESLAPQLTDEVEVVIGDDGKTAETEKILRDFPGVRIHYFSNPDGPGYGKNVSAITNHASGEFVWWCGDDDAFASGAIGRVLNIIQENPEVDFIWSDYTFSGFEKPILGLGKGRLFRDRNEVVEKVANHLGYISSIIFRKDVALPHATLTSPYIDTAFFNLYIVMQVLANGRKSYYMGEPGIINHPQVVGRVWYDGFKLYGIDYWKIVENFRGKFKNSSLRTMIAKNFGHFWRGMLVGRGHGGESDWVPPHAAKILFRYYWSYPGYWAAFPFLIMPKRIEQLFYKLYKKIF